MKAVATKQEFVCLDRGQKWELYDTVGGQVIDTVYKADNGNYLDALLHKWGYRPARFDVASHDDLVPNLQALGYTPEDFEQERARRRKQALLGHLQDSLSSLALTRGNNGSRKEKA